MSNLRKINCLFLMLFFTVTLASKGQSKSDSSQRDYKNIVRMNITNPMLFGDKYTVIGYERKIKDYQTASVNLGRFSLPKWRTFNNDSLNMTSEYDDLGFTAAFDYRFYLKSENRHAAPRGVYIGPYYSFNRLNRNNKWEMNNDSYQGAVETEMTFTANLVGFQIGYQFVFWKRVSLDMIFFGPGAWFYKMKMDVKTDLSPEEIEEIYDRINDELSNIMPGHELLVPKSEYENSGVTSTYSAGYRIMMQLGFLF